MVDDFVREFAREILNDNAGVFLGAGTSMAAGYPSWRALVEEIARDLKLTIEDHDDLAAVVQWSLTRDLNNRTIIVREIRNQIEPERKIPDAILSLSRLPVRNIWTTNYDTLVERAMKLVRRPVDRRFKQDQLTSRLRVPAAVRLFKMHGSVEDPADIVISTEDYELFNQSRGAFLSLLEAHLVSMTFLFIGLSLTDPNVKHVLSLLRQRFPTTPPRHFIITRRPQPSDFDTDETYKARVQRHDFWAQDLKRYGLHVLEVASYQEIDDILLRLEKEVARNRVFISGSYPEGDHAAADVGAASTVVGQTVAERGLSLVSGYGLTVGPNAVAGFLRGLQVEGEWALERRLIVRPFPFIEGDVPSRAAWRDLRAELARVSGITIFVGGWREESGVVRPARGVGKEYIAARRNGHFIIPVGGFGGAAEIINRRLRGSQLAFEGRRAIRPTDAELDALLETREHHEIRGLVSAILDRVGLRFGQE